MEDRPEYRRINRVSAGAQPLELMLVYSGCKTQQAGDAAEQIPQRIREIRILQRLERVAPGQEQAAGLQVPVLVQGEYRGLLERGGKIGCGSGAEGGVEH